MPVRIITENGDKACQVECTACGHASGPWPFTVAGLIDAANDLDCHPCATPIHRDLMRQLIAERFGRPK